jgi:hypothetical protein
MIHKDTTQETGGKPKRPSLNQKFAFYALNNGRYRNEKGNEYS